MRCAKVTGAAGLDELLALSTDLGRFEQQIASPRVSRVLGECQCRPAEQRRVVVGQSGEQDQATSAFLDPERSFAAVEGFWPQFVGFLLGSLPKFARSHLRAVCRACDRTAGLRPTLVQ